MSQISDLTGEIPVPESSSTKTVSMAGIAMNKLTTFWTKQNPYEHQPHRQNPNHQDLKLRVHGSGDEDAISDPDPEDGSYIDDGKERKGDHDLSSSDSSSESEEEKSLSDIPKIKKHSSERKRKTLKSSKVRGEKRMRQKSNRDTDHSSSQNSVSFNDRMLELSKTKDQDLKRNFPFTRSLHRQYDGYCSCNACGKEVNFRKKSSIANHVKSEAHIDNMKTYEKKLSSQEIMRKVILKSRDHRFEEEDSGLRNSSDTELFRSQTCKAFIIDNIPFNLLDNPDPESLVGLLKPFLSKLNTRSVKDAIPMVFSSEIKQIESEISEVKHFGVIFDATPSRGEAFGVVLRWMDDLFEIHHRCISLIFYNQCFNHLSLGTHFTSIIPLSMCNIFTFHIFGFDTLSSGIL